MDNNNPKCWHYESIDKDDNQTCTNCRHWGWTRCKDEKLLMERIDRGPSFDAYDRMMKGNRGVWF